MAHYKHHVRETLSRAFDKLYDGGTLNDLIEHEVDYKPTEITVRQALQMGNHCTDELSAEMRIVVNEIVEGWINGLDCHTYAKACWWMLQICANPE